jgi:hypothetical protein
MRAAVAVTISPSSFSPAIQNAFSGETSESSGLNWPMTGYQRPASASRLLN